MSQVTCAHKRTQNLKGSPTMGQQETVAAVTAGQLREKDFFPNFSVGDTINVHYTIVEGDKERVQVFPDP